MVEVSIMTNPTRPPAEVRLQDMTPADVLVLADQVKDQGLGLTPTDQIKEGDWGYLAYCPSELEEAFTQVFPCRLGQVRNLGRPARQVWLFEDAALRAVLRAFGLTEARVCRHVTARRAYSTLVVFDKRPPRTEA
jgi:hypothetical protein